MWPSRVVGREAVLLEEEKMEVEKMGVPLEFGVLGGMLNTRERDMLSQNAVRLAVRSGGCKRGRGLVWDRQWRSWRFSRLLADCSVAEDSKDMEMDACSWDVSFQRRSIRRWFEGVVRPAVCLFLLFALLSRLSDLSIVINIDRLEESGRE